MSRAAQFAVLVILMMSIVCSGQRGFDHMACKAIFTDSGGCVCEPMSPECQPVFTDSGGCACVNPNEGGGGGGGGGGGIVD